MNAYTTGGKALSMYATVKSGDTIVKSGFTPFTYTGTTGNTYSVEVSNYGGLTFSKWGDATTSNPRSIALLADTTATAYYSEGAASPASSCKTVEPAATTASGNDGNVPANTIDNNLSTRWSNNGAGSWIQYDLGQGQTVCDVKVAWYKGNERQSNFAISVSTDGQSYQNVYTGKSSGTTLSEETYNFADVAARYVRLTVNGNSANSWASVTEVNVSAAGAAAPSGSPVALSFAGLAVGQTVTGSVSFTVVASDPSKVSSVKAYVDGTKLIKEELYAPYDFSLNTSSYSSGTHQIVATAGLKDGTTVSKSISVVFGGSTTPAPTPTPTPTPSSGTDQFGVKMIHPTKSSGQQWFMNMADPDSDSRFDPKETITQNSDGSWKMTSDQVRMNVFTSAGYHPERITTYNQQQLASKGYMQDPSDWKNVEITGFVKVNSASDDNFAWYSRGGKHTDSDGGCEGTAYKGNLFYDGQVRFAKEQQHADGYSFTSEVDATSSVMGRWVGFKTVMYNNAQGNVVLQTWINENADKVTWKKVDEKVDSGGWGSDGDMCGGSPDQKITWGGPITTFRWDSASNVDFKWLSVREIQPPA
ncbi:discoidin domain-containing protein [Candidatus Nitrososphaera sp. FF02]|uniref:discoidin domain-containing protein n=1 Tax=Candidatus Nitrososphaera sp. FF02 TaxID=3398226 RepID=UPI0039E89EE8